MKVKNDHRSKFFNLSNWKEEAWKKRGLPGDSKPWPPRIPVTLVAPRSIYWVHIFPWGVKLWFFQASSFQLLKLENLLRWSLFTLNNLVKNTFFREIRISPARVGLDLTNHSTDNRLRSWYHSPGDKIPTQPWRAARIHGMRAEQHHRQVLQKPGKV